MSVCWRMSERFKVGKSYTTRSMTDYDSLYCVTVVRRTKKTVWFNLEGRHSGDVRTCRVHLNGGIETIKPCGNYSMCPVIWATSEDATLTPPGPSQGETTEQS